MRCTRNLAVLAVLFASGCVEPRETLGGQCELSSDCDAPLVCRLERCRKECLTSRDCALGLRCLVANDGLGVCQLPEEATCDLDSDCIDPLVCISEGCTNECASERDCVPGASCIEGRCVEPVPDLCLYPSDCPFPLVCGDNRLCQVECATDLDCRRLGDTHACFPHATCGTEAIGDEDGLCMCRRPCTQDSECPAGTVCTGCPEDILGASGDPAPCPAPMYCERPENLETP